MSAVLAAAVLLITVPIAFNAAFFELGRAFDYPSILRRPPDEILRRFSAGGSGLVLRWQALLVSALAMLPLVAVVSVVLEPPPMLGVASVVVGTSAALVQALGLARWPFVVPELARRYVSAEGPEAATARQTIEVVFVAMHRMFGTGLGEHLGYLLTGTWTLLVAASVLSTGALPGWLGFVGLPIAAAMVLGSFEFVGRNEEHGWSLAGAVVPVVYVAWSLWLVALGVALLL